MKKIPINEDWLKKKYLDERLTFKEIGLLIGCNWTTVMRRAKKLGIPVRKAIMREWVQTQKSLARDEYRDVPNLKRAVIKAYGYKCMIPGCTYDRFLDLHHIEGKNVWTEKHIGIKTHTHNRISNTVLLCPNHHREADSKFIDAPSLRLIVSSRKLKT